MTFYVQGEQSYVPHDVSPGKSFSQFVDIGHTQEENLQIEDSFEAYQREHLEQGNEFS